MYKGFFLVIFNVFFEQFFLESFELFALYYIIKIYYFLNIIYKMLN